MTTLASKREAVLKAVRTYLREKEGRVVERQSNTGTVYFHTKKEGKFCGKLIRVSNHATTDKTVLTSLRYDLIGNSTSRKAVVQKVFNTLDNCAESQSLKRLNWLLAQI